MQIDFVIILSIVVFIVTLAGMGYAIRFAFKHIAEDSEKAKQRKL